MTGRFLRAKGSPPVDQDDSSGSVVGSSGMTYRPVRELGEGGTARAVLAYGAGSGGFSKLVVLKILREQLADTPACREMFEAEARLSALLNHPNLVQVYDVVHAEVPFLVMEYLDGKPLSRVFSIAGMNQAMLLTIVAEALIGLHHAHELSDFENRPLNIVHRDVSPHNVFVTYDGVVKVLDFGIAKAAGVSSTTETGEIKGKLAYMAPEQLLGQKVDRRADVFAAGCILWEAAVGSRIWGEMSDGAVMHRLATGEIPRPGGDSAMDPRLEQIVVKATAAAPEDRYATALELQRDVTAYIADRWGPCSMRDVGAALAENFKEERERNRKLLGSAFSDSATVAAGAAARSKNGARPAEAVRKGPGRRSLALAAAGALAVVGSVGLWLLRPNGQATAVKPVPQAPASVHVRIRATPPGAAIEIDGADRGLAPVALDVTPDTQDHSIRATAAGYVPERRTINFSRDLELEFSLDKMAAKVEPPPSSTAAALSPPRYEPQRRLVVPKPKGVASAEEPRCSPPYYFANGIKTFKPECL